jgi:hypothetical protein
MLMLAMEVIPAIRRRLATLDEESERALRSGQRAALWRAQQQAARLDRTLEDLRRYCLEALEQRSFLHDEDENDYLRGFRLGFQAGLEDIRRLELRR